MRAATVLVLGLAALAAGAADGRSQELPPLDLRGGLQDEGLAAVTLAEPGAGQPGDATPAVATPENEPDTGRAEREGQAAEADEDEDGEASARRLPADDDPYAPLGIRAGGFILLPSLQLSAGYTTNASGIAGGAGSGFWTVAPELLLNSDWAEHEATLRLRGSWQQYTDGITDDQPTASAVATGRIDLPAAWQLDLTGGYDFSHQSVSDPNFPAGVDEAPGVHALIATAAASGDIGRLAVTVAGSAARTIYENGLAGDVVVDQGDRTNNLYETRLRVGYPSSATITPFVEGELGWRVYDRPVDDEGIARGSRLAAVRAGIEYDNDPILKGEVALGYGEVAFDDPALARLSALTLDGSLTWTPTPLLTLTLDAGTAFNPSDDPLSSGSIARSASLGLDYAWRRNVTLKWTASVGDERYQGLDLRDTTYDVGFGWVWKLNRVLWVTADYVHEWLRSSDPSSDYASDAVTVGLRWQR